MSPTIRLSPLEARVLGVLVEKQHTVPDTYPLTLNALVAGCNQKTSRDPVMEASDAEVQAALDRLKSLSLVVESSGGRTMRYAQNAPKAFNLPPMAIALLAVLFLRGPQTAGELRINSERLHKFGDILAVEGFLTDLQDKGFVRELPKQAGARETRWAHLLSGEPPAAQPPAAAKASESNEASDRLDRLEAEVRALRAAVERIASQLGIEPE